jgi:hypothetical protein
LNLLLRGEKVPRRVMVPPRGVIQRRSTDAVNAPLS